MTIPAFEPERGHGVKTVPPLLDLDDPRCSDPRVSGGKAASLSLARSAGLAVLPGVVVAAAASRSHMEVGADALARRGSGGARLEVSATPLDDALARALSARVAGLGEQLVVRSSSVLEATPEWSGAFTSYVDVTADDVPRAVTGCWASAFGPATLARHEAAGVEPGSAEMAVLIQPSVEARFGGTAHLEGGDVVITAVAGSPAPLVQGWEPGCQARLDATGVARGAALDLIGHELAAAIARLLQRADDTLGIGGCEWAAAGDEIFLLQVNRGVTTRPAPSASRAAKPSIEVARLVRRYPGPLGEALVLPWALAEPAAFLEDAEPFAIDPRQALETATAEAARLTADVWSRPEAEARRSAQLAFASLRGGDAAPELIKALSPPDRERTGLVLKCLATVRRALVEAGAVTWPESAWYLEPERVREILSGEEATKRVRIGYDRWEPFNAAVVMAEGNAASGAPSAPGIGCGRLRWVSGPDDWTQFRPREVVVAPYPIPNLAALLWDAAGVVTTGGGPAAHLFESARALGIPAVSGVDPTDVLEVAPAAASGGFAIAVDGSTGSVFVSEW